MRIKGSIAKGLLVALAFTLIPASAISAQKVSAGSVCKVQKQKVTYKNKVYKCVKSGKKLVWNKGVAIKKPTPVVTPTPTSAPIVEDGVCEKMGLQGKDSVGLLECRKIAGNKLVYTRILNDFSPVVNPTSPDIATLCQLPDLRTEIPEWRPAIAYPARPQSNFKVSGTFKIVVVGIDFSDAPGTDSPSALWKEDLPRVTEWLKWYTNDNVKYEFVTNPKWLRAPKTSEKYDAQNNTIKGPGVVEVGGMNDEEIAADYFQAINDSVNLSNVNAIWIYLPENISKITGQWTTQIANLKSPKYGALTPMMVALGSDTYLSKRVRWGYFIHELLHAHGLWGHSPKFIPTNGKFTRIGALTTADGWSNALLPWDALVANWQKPGDIYCVDKPKLTNSEIRLVPLEREQIGVRSVMIKLSGHQVLIIESHRSDKWGVWEGQGSGGVMVSLIDTKISTSWDQPGTVNNPTSTGVYLKVEGANHGSHEPIGSILKNGGQTYFGVGVVNGVGIAGDYEAWDLNHVMYPGESITSNGIKVTLIKGGDNDTVRIEKIG
jgi:hypothetical protein